MRACGADRLSSPTLIRNSGDRAERRFRKPPWEWCWSKIEGCPLGKAGTLANYRTLRLSRSQPSRIKRGRTQSVIGPQKSPKILTNSPAFPMQNLWTSHVRPLGNGATRSVSHLRLTLGAPGPQEGAGGRVGQKALF